MHARSTSSAPFLLYGATGYTGRLIAALAVARGLRPVLAGRSAAPLAALAGELGLSHRVAALDDAGALDAALADVPLVLHAAGPFVHTAAPMVAACLRTGTHYLDITGEIEVFEALAARDREARQAGITLLPGVGFDVVPTDCLAAHLRQRLPSAKHLRLAVYAGNAASHGTAQTSVLHLGRGAVRRAGRIVAVPPGNARITVDFGDGKPRTCIAIPWGDVSTAFHSTGIPDITTYAAVATRVARLIRAGRWFGPVLRSPPVQAMLRRAISRRITGPTATQRAQGHSCAWGEVSDASGRRAQARWTGPEAYAFTADAALHAVNAVLAGKAPIGFQTPARAFGADFALAMAGTRREDVA